MNLPVRNRMFYSYETLKSMFL